MPMTEPTHMHRRRAIAVLLCSATVTGRSLAAPDAQQVYMSVLPNGLPSFTNAPVQADDRLVMKWNEPPPRPPTAAEPMPARPVRSSVLPPALAARTPDVARGGVDAIIRSAASAYRVEGALIRAVIEVESGFNANARSGAGAIGLMQLMPATARRYGVRNARDPVQNIDGGTRYLRDLLDLFKGDTSLALAGYNAGEGAVLQHGRRIPPFAETRAYVPKVLARYREHRLASADRALLR
jgi:soluble lytic murein transglycosylase-like protein